MASANVGGAGMRVADGVAVGGTPVGMGVGVAAGVAVGVGAVVGAGVGVAVGTGVGVAVGGGPFRSPGVGVSSHAGAAPNATSATRTAAAMARGLVIPSPAVPANL